MHIAEGGCGHYEDMLMILGDVTIGNLVEGLLEFLFFRKFQQSVRIIGSTGVLTAVIPHGGTTGISRAVLP